MGLVRYVGLSLCLVIGGLAFGQSHDWLPVTQQDLQFKDVPGNPGAAAVRLYYAHYIDDNSYSEFYYERIKILNEKALNPSERRSYADVEIPVESLAGNYAGLIVNLENLKARTIHPDGSIVEFTGSPFEKTIFKGRGSKVAVKAFSMPSVTVGSIVEYKFELNYQVPMYLNAVAFAPGEWILQSELYTVNEHVHYRPFEGGTHQSPSRAMLYWSGRQVSRVAFNLKEQPKSIGNESDLELHDVPAFEPEEYMPPENNFKPSVVFFYSPRGVDSIDKGWQELGKERYTALERFLDKNGGVKEAAVQAASSEADPTRKLHKLYERVQQVRNLSYERRRTAEEMKKENLQRNLGVDDVLAHGYGTKDEITLLFIAMARAAGFDASTAQASDRRRRFFAKDWTSLEQINNMMATVNLNGTDLFLEPGIKYCPFGLVRWNHTATDALRLDKKGSVLIKVPPSAFDKSVARRTASLSLTPEGTLKGDVRVEFQGEEALEHRLYGINEDDAGRKKSLEDEIKAWLPTGAIVNMADSRGWEDVEGPLVASFSVEVPSYASVAGKLLLIPSFLFQSQQNRAFIHSSRKYPVYFAYAFTETDSVSIKVPAGFSLESVPQQQDASLKYARYQNLTQFEGGQLISQRNLAINGIYFGLDKYPELKDFFAKVKTGDEQQAVLRGGAVNAQKSN